MRRETGIGAGTLASVEHQRLGTIRLVRVPVNEKSVLLASGPGRRRRLVRPRPPKIVVAPEGVPNLEVGCAIDQWSSFKFGTVL